MKLDKDSAMREKFSASNEFMRAEGKNCQAHIKSRAEDHGRKPVGFYSVLRFLLITGKILEDYNDRNPTSKLRPMSVLRPDVAEDFC